MGYWDDIKAAASGVGDHISELNDEYSLGTRAMGGLQAAGGAIQTVGGVAFGTVTAPTGVGAVVGGGVAVLGMDQTATGLRTLFTGEETDSLVKMGVSHMTGSDSAGFWADIAGSMASPASAFTAGKGLMAIAKARNIDDVLALARAGAGKIGNAYQAAKGAFKAALEKGATTIDELTALVKSGKVSPEEAKAIKELVVEARKAEAAGGAGAVVTKGGKVTDDAAEASADASKNNKAAKDGDAAAESTSTATKTDGPEVTGGEPVDAITGKVFVEQEDFSLPWRVPLNWKRHYSSDSRRYGAVGVGWECPADSRLEICEDGSVKLWHLTPGAKVFPELPKPGESFVLKKDGTRLSHFSDRIEVTTKSGLKHVFTDKGRRKSERVLERVVDLDGNFLHYQRDGQGVLTGIASSCGPRLELKSAGEWLEEVILHHPDHESRILIRYEQSSAKNLIAAYDPLGVPYTFEYRNHCLVRHSDRNGVSFYYEYDEETAEGRCLHTWGDDGLFDAYLVFQDEEKVVQVVDSCGQSKLLEYDDQKRLVAETDAAGARVSYEYDGEGRYTKVTDPLGGETSYAYDEFGNVLEVTRPDGVSLAYQYDENHRPVESKDANGQTWKQEFDERNHLIRQISPLGAEREFRYDRRGDLISAIDAMGNKTRFSYDSQGTSLQKLTDALGHSTKWEHGPLGHPLRIVDPSGAETQFEYDEKSRLTRQVKADGNEISCAYDKELNLTRFTDELGHETRFEYGFLNRLISKELPNETEVKYEYDTENRLTAVINGRGERYLLQRDPLGRVINEVDYWGRSTRYSYDVGGRLLERIDPMGRTTNFEHDVLGRVTARVFGDGYQENLAYNPAGQLVESTTPQSSVQRKYDQEGRLVAESQNEFTLRYRYDLAGRVIERSSEAGNVVRYDYDAVSRLNGIRVNGKRVREFKRDARGLPVKEQIGDVMQRTNQFDSLAFLTEQKTTAQGQVVVQRAYDYDAAGNLSALRDGLKGDEQFAYDPVGQLLKHTDPMGKIHDFVRDAAGDFLEQGPAEVAETGPVEEGGDLSGRAGQEKVGKPIRKASFGGVDYRFDAAGNVVKRSEKGRETKLEWDGANRLKMGRVNGIPIRFSYDAHGRRLSKTKKGEETQFAWEGDALLAENKGKGWREYIMMPGGFTPVAFVEEGSVYHYEVDQVGMPREVFDESGGLAWSASPDAWGGIGEQLENKIENRIRLQGQYEDEELGLNYNRNRYYDPNIGGFLSLDPMGLAAGNNVYAVSPNVQLWVDPLGLNSFCSMSSATNPKGGMHGQMTSPRPEGWESHHIIADKATSQTKYSGAAVLMRSQDHALTSSFRNAAAVTAERQTLMNGGAAELFDRNVNEILDIAASQPDIPNTFYDDALLEAMELFENQGVDAYKAR